MAGHRAANSFLVALVSTIMLIVGSELFLRYSTNSALKLASLGLLVAGIALLGVTGWARREAIAKLMALLVFVGYLVAATNRFSGLLKEPRPYGAIDLIGFGAKMFLLAIIATAGVAIVRVLLRRMLPATAVSTRHRSRSKT